MTYISVVVFSSLICGSWSAEQLKFPPSFMFGAASAAYQVEGAWNVSDKGLSVWDKLIHERPELVADGSNGDVACDSYHLWSRDIQMCEELGLNMYRFSISWPRLLPSGYPNHISEDGKNYYNNLIDGLLEKGIQPLVTLYHFDLPLALQDLGGWANPLIADWFADYANVVFSLYADRVKYWLTINEAYIQCDAGYEKQLTPFFDDPMLGRYLCNKNVLMAHAKAYRVYDEFYREKYHGKLSLATLFFWFKPFTPEDQEVTDLTIDHWEGRYAHAVFSKEGGWPRKLEKLLNDIAKKEGYSHPRLPPFTPEEIELVRGSYDYYALNHYTTRMVRRTKPGEPPGKWLFHGSEELNTVMYSDPAWETTPVDWFAVRNILHYCDFPSFRSDELMANYQQLQRSNPTLTLLVKCFRKIYPEGLREQLNWLNSTYDVKEIVITENGVPSLDPGLVDTQRLEYYRDYLEQILLAINDGINVTGYTAWTLMDNFEWMSGYIAKFGLYAVDFSDPNRSRTPRESARYYSNVIRSRKIHPTKYKTKLNYV